jgi:hypothetical protein
MYLAGAAAIYAWRSRARTPKNIGASEGRGDANGLNNGGGSAAGITDLPPVDEARQ